MGYKIVIDSCGELPEKLQADGHYESVALELEVDDYHVTDDKTFNQLEFLRRVKESKNCPKSSCPSPERYMEAFAGDAENIYVVTLSSKLSGSYNSAVLAKKLYEEEHPDKQIYVFDSCSASIGETLIGMKAQECEESGKGFEETVETVEKYISEQRTFFVLETLDTLRKNGRLSNLKCVCGGGIEYKAGLGPQLLEGTICQLDQARGINKALERMIRHVISKTKDCEHKILAISHCNCPERAKAVKEKIEELVKFKEIIIVNTAGVSTMYANDGGVIMAV